MTRTKLQRIFFFIQTRYPLPKYIFYSTFWTTVMMELFHFTGTGQGALTVNHGMAVFLVFCLLLFLRSVDEIKDLAYDAKLNPQRALPSGKTKVSDVYFLLTVVFLIIGPAAFTFNPTVGLTSLLTMLYSLFLFWVDRRFTWFADTMYLNLFFAIQLKTLTIITVYYIAKSPNATLPSMADWIVIVAFLAAYLHWETTRKIAWPEQAQKEEKLYSKEVGVWPSLAIGTSMLFAAVAAVRTIFEAQTDLLIFIPCACSFVGIAGFLFYRKIRIPLGAFSLVSYLLFLGVVFIQTNLQSF